MKLIIIFALLTATVASVTAQLHPRQDGVDIEQREFDSLCSTIIGFKSLHYLSKEEAIITIRIYNTISRDSSLMKNSYYTNILKKIDTIYFDKIIKILDFKISTGYGYYSKQYEIRIDGYFILEKNSLYKIKRN